MVVLEIGVIIMKNIRFDTICNTKDRTTRTTIIIIVSVGSSANLLL